MRTATKTIRTPFNQRTSTFQILSAITHCDWCCAHIRAPYAFRSVDWQSAVSQTGSCVTPPDLSRPPVTNRRHQYTGCRRYVAFGAGAGVGCFTFNSMCRSRSCFGSTVLGESVIRHVPFAVFGNAMTSRMRGVVLWIANRPYWNDFSSAFNSGHSGDAGGVRSLMSAKILRASAGLSRTMDFAYSSSIHALRGS